MFVCVSFMSVCVLVGIVGEAEECVFQLIERGCGFPCVFV